MAASSPCNAGAWLQARASRAEALAARSRVLLSVCDCEERVAVRVLTLLPNVVRTVEDGHVAGEVDDLPHVVEQDAEARIRDADDLAVQGRRVRGVVIDEGEVPVHRVLVVRARTP